MKQTYAKYLMVAALAGGFLFTSCRTARETTTPYCITMALIRAVKGDVDNALIFCGANAWKINEITTVPALIHELTE